MSAIATYNRVVIEAGTKRVFASAIDWPGWSRGAKTEAEPLKALTPCRQRYRPVAALDSELDGTGDHEVIETRKGTGSTDFWGISFAASPFDVGPLDFDVIGSSHHVAVDKM